MLKNQFIIDTACQAPIGVFDSGIGGLSILKILQSYLPKEQFIYYADSAYAPYGEKTDKFIIDRCITIADQLLHHYAIKALVVACNTATAAAITDLRLKYPHIPIIGIEPALKPAVAHSVTHKVAVLATRSTLSSIRFQSLLQEVQAQSPITHIMCHACDGLADAIEKHWFNLDHPIIHTGIQHHLNTMRIKDNYDTLVLGCTHYPLVLNIWRQYIPHSVYIIDNGMAIAQQLERRLNALHLRNQQFIMPASVYLSSESTKVVDKIEWFMKDLIN